MGNNNYCFPLTISDWSSRFVISCEAPSSTEAGPCFAVFEEAFEKYRLPLAIRSDNRTPFACGNSTWNLSRLSAWWMRLGIKLERIEPGKPQQNSWHERMHRTLKFETTKPPAAICCSNRRDSIVSPRNSTSKGCTRRLI
jgi:putative transposase